MGFGEEGKNFLGNFFPSSPITNQPFCSILEKRTEGFTNLYREQCQEKQEPCLFISLSTGWNKSDKI